MNVIQIHQKAISTECVAVVFKGSWGLLPQGTDWTGEPTGESPSRRSTPDSPNFSLGRHNLASSQKSGASLHTCRLNPVINSNVRREIHPTLRLWALYNLAGTFTCINPLVKQIRAVLFFPCLMLGRNWDLGDPGTGPANSQVHLRIHASNSSSNALDREAAFPACVTPSGVSVAPPQISFRSQLPLRWVSRGKEQRETQWAGWMER